MIWNEDNLVELACGALASAAREFDSENAPRGIDCLNEVELQQRISAALNLEKVVTVKEARYPAARLVQRLNHGKRCDLLLFRDPADLRLVSHPDADKVGYWLEIKRVAQFLESNWHYERMLLEGAAHFAGFFQLCLWISSSTGQPVSIGRLLNLVQMSMLPLMRSQRAGSGSGPAIVLKRSTTSGSRGSSLMTF